MTGQEAIPLPAQREQSQGLCLWCGAETTQRVMVEKERYRMYTNGGKQTKVVAQHAKTPFCCRVCSERMEWTRGHVVSPERG